MQLLFTNFRAVTRSLSYLLGGFVVALAVAVYGTSYSADNVIEWLENTLGLVFCALLTLLSILTLFCLVKLTRAKEGNTLWLEAGLQAASGIATLALTFTLLGISLGIGSLASQTLTPETVQEVIRGLTEKFSLAFFTTVVGLPLSSVLRALLLVVNAAKANQEREKHDLLCPPSQ